MRILYDYWQQKIKTILVIRLFSGHAGVTGYRGGKMNKCFCVIKNRDTLPQSFMKVQIMFGQ